MQKIGISNPMCPAKQGAVIADRARTIWFSSFPYVMDILRNGLHAKSMKMIEGKKKKGKRAGHGSLPSNLTCSC